jgi:hypothetical protein
MYIWDTHPPETLSTPGTATGIAQRMQLRESLPISKSFVDWTVVAILVDSLHCHFLK